VRAATIADRKEHVEFWDVDDIETLDTYKEKVRAIRAAITKPDQEKANYLVFSPSSASATARAVAKWRSASSGRVGISKTPAFHQWTQYWNLAHVFRHEQNALSAIPAYLDASLQFTAALHLSPVGS